MLNQDIIKKIKTIHIKSGKIVSEVFAGEYTSSFRGLGLEFEEVREYQPGDEIRTIDWNVTARYSKPYVKVFREERELTVYILVDVSSSEDFGTIMKLKREQAAEIAAVLSFSAIRSNDRVSLLLFTDIIEEFIPPRKGAGHVWHIIKEVIDYKPERRGTSIKTALKHLVNVGKKGSVVFIISDFIDTDFENSLKLISKKFDTVAICIYDEAEKNPPPFGIIEIGDPEGRGGYTVDFTSKSVRDFIKMEWLKRRDYLEKTFRTAGIDSLFIKTSEDYIPHLLKLFRMREKRQ